MKNRFEEHNAGQALHYALTLLTQKAYTSYKLRQKLKDKGYQLAEIENALLKLEEWKYIDDKAYALDYIKNRGEKTPKQKIKMKLHQQGISKELSSPMLDAYYQDHSERIHCLPLARKIWEEEKRKWRRKENKGKYSSFPEKTIISKKVAEKLQLKGYNHSVIWSVIQEISESFDTMSMD